MNLLFDGQQLTGQVIDFDEHRGLGTVSITGENGSGFNSLPFHCINIVNGSRKIEVGANVEFKVFWHPRGRFEAKKIQNIR